MVLLSSYHYSPSPQLPPRYVTSYSFCLRFCSAAMREPKSFVPGMWLVLELWILSWTLDSSLLRMFSLAFLLRVCAWIASCLRIISIPS